MGARFGDVVRDARKARRWSQEELGEKAGVSQTFVSTMEKADAREFAGTPALVTKVLDALGVDANALPSDGKDGRKQSPEAISKPAEVVSAVPDSDPAQGPPEHERAKPVDDKGIAAALTAPNAEPVPPAPPQPPPPPPTDDELRERLRKGIGAAFSHWAHDIEDVVTVREMIEDSMILSDSADFLKDVGVVLLDTAARMRRQRIPMGSRQFIIGLAITAASGIRALRSRRDSALAELRQIKRAYEQLAGKKWEAPPPDFSDFGDTTDNDDIPF